MDAEINPPADPWALFAEWFAEAKQQEPSHPEAMMLATVGADGMPSLRAVLMKDFDSGGIVFHTNRDSRKGRELAAHPQASVCFYWKSLQRQVRIEGRVELLSDAESDAYFSSRPRGSQISAWASQQSRALDNRAALERRIADIEKQYQGRDVPRPPYWGGYRLAPISFEFWQERLHRLHDRVSYSKTDDRIAYTHAAGAKTWMIERLYP